MIGWYAHHQGRGHVHRALALATHLAQAGEEVTVLSSAARPEGSRVPWVALARDDDGDVAGAASAVAGGSAAWAAPGSAPDPTAHGHLHWVPRHHAGLRARTAALSAWIEECRPRVVVVDVSQEVALLARLHGVPVVSTVLPGDRTDPAHALGLGVSDALLGFWPAGAGLARLPAEVADRLHEVGGLSRFDGPGGVDAATGADRASGGLLERSSNASPLRGLNERSSNASPLRGLNERSSNPSPLRGLNERSSNRRDPLLAGPGDGGGAPRTPGGPGTDDRDPRTPGPRRLAVMSGRGGDAWTTAELAVLRDAAAGAGWEVAVLGGDAWVDDPWAALVAADVVVTHAGQNALAEVAAARCPAVVVPAPRPHDEQASTARALAAGRWPVQVLDRLDPGARAGDGSAAGAAAGTAARTGAGTWGGPSWPALLDEVAALDGDAWAAWSDGRAAERVARVLAEVAR